LNPERDCSNFVYGYEFRKFPVFKERVQDALGYLSTRDVVKKIIVPAV